MKKKIKISLMLATAVAVCWWATNLVLRNDELGSKHEWSILQVAEVKSRTMADVTEVVLDSLESYHMMGVRSDSPKGGWVWILLDPKHEPLIKILPDQPFHLSERDMNRVAAAVPVNRLVLQMLQAHVVNPP